MTMIDKGHKAYNNPVVLEPLEYLQLTNDTKAKLQDVGIYHIGQLIVETENTLYQKHGIGRKYIAEINQALNDRCCLSLGVICDIPLRGGAEIKEFFCITNATSPTSVTHIHVTDYQGLYADITLPSAMIDGLSHETIVAAIKNICQSSFEKAVINEGITTITDAASALSIDPPLTIPLYAFDIIPLPDGPTQDVQIALDCPKYLMSAFNQTAFQNAARFISGNTLYSDLKTTLETLTPKPI